MFYLPVVFTCFLNAQCGFVYDKPEVTQTQCDRTLADMMSQVSKLKDFQGAKGTCIPVPNGKMI